MDKVLVTGATGFIGKQLVKLLLQKNYQVRVLIRDNQKSLFFPKHVEIFIGDLTNRVSMHNVCKDIDTLFHLGGYAHALGDNNTSFSDKHDQVNFQGTNNILDEAIQNNVKRFIFFSSVKAVADSETCIDENWNKLPLNPYGIAKRKAEDRILNANKSGMHVCILRPALVYGPGWKGNLASMLHAIDRGIFPPLPKIKNVRSMVSIEDICNAALLAAYHPASNGKVYFVTDGVSYSTHQLYTLMSNALGKHIPKWFIPLSFFMFMAKIGDLGKKLIKRRLPFDSDAFSKLFGSAFYSSEKIQNDLGFKPTLNLSMILPEIIQAYRK